MDENGIENYLTTHCSRTCEFAVRTRGPQVIDAEAVRRIFRETEQGVFARDWMQEWALGMPQLHGCGAPRRKAGMETTGGAWRRDFGK